MSHDSLSIRFYRSSNGREPVRDWLKEQGRPDSLIIGEDIRLVQIAWPVGMPVCLPLVDGLYEIRSSLPQGRIARVLFCFCDGEVILLHAFIKKTPQTPAADLKLAKERKSKYLAAGSLDDKRSTK
jgi:phage-related protein